MSFTLASASLCIYTNNIKNKTSSAVQLKHLRTGLVLKVQATRSRTQNRKIARQMLAERIDEMERGAESRTAIVREAKSKKKSSAAKKSRRKYRALDEAKKAAAEEEPSSEGAEGGEEKSKDVQ